MTMRGFIYLATSPTLPGVVKVGKTHTVPPSKTFELAISPGVKTTFILQLSIETDFVSMNESRLVVALSKARYGGKSDLFKMSVPDAIKIGLPVIQDWRIQDCSKDSAIQRLSLTLKRSLVQSQHLFMIMARHSIPFIKRL
ncbi:MAG: hypothetical protein SV429_01455 [Pseudomonadota bacterium]|nr:hypothetical protein [Pseudomonadota bacterium]